MMKFDKVAYNKEYNVKNYKQLKANLKFEDYEIIDNYCKDMGISKASFIVKSCKYVIKNDINL